MTTWKDFFERCKIGNENLFSDACRTDFGDGAIDPGDDDVKAAGRLHIELLSRIATQKLDYLTGTEQGALTSLYQLFGETRKISERYPTAQKLERLAWDVLNRRLRPFTAKWHRESSSGLLAALDSADEFRDELANVQKYLRAFDQVLVDFRDKKLPKINQEEIPDERTNKIKKEMRDIAAWTATKFSSPPQADFDANRGSNAVTAGNANNPRMEEKAEPGHAKKANGAKPGGKVEVEAVIAAEKDEITKRRKFYGLDEGKLYTTGLALSGGGIRSATFSLGVVIALAKRGVLPHFDYLSTVSGGGYLGSFISAYLKTPEESAEIKGVDHKTSHHAASGKKATEPKPAEQTTSDQKPPEQEPSAPKSVPIGLRPSESPFHRDSGEASPLRHLRHHCSYLTAGSWKRHVRMMAAVFQGMVLNGLGLALVAATLALVESLLTQDIVHWWNWTYILAGSVLAIFVCFVGTLVLVRMGRFFQKSADWACGVVLLLLGGLLLVKGVRDLHTWFGSNWLPPPTGLWWTRTLWIFLLAGVPLVGSLLVGLFGRVLGRKGLSFIAGTASFSIVFFLGLYLLAYEWISTKNVTFPWDTQGYPLPLCWTLAALAAGWLLYLFFFDINYTSPHRHYRNSLADTFLIQRAAGDADETKAKFHRGVDVRLSTLVAAPVRGPYHLINCALNVPATKNAAVQGRHVDFFLFSAKFCGSPLTKYLATTKWEEADQRLNVGTAMAISAAAASPLMGLGTMNHLRFWLALLNIRLGYWVKKPGHQWKLPPGLLYLLREMTGLIDEKSSRINLSDGGHIENLGVYELLRRRCRFIVAIDGEEDHAMTFAALTTLQRLAAIDLDTKIDIDLEDVRLNAEGLSRSHFRLARIHYPSPKGQRATGYLLYVKLSLTGNEGEFIRRYRRDEPVFPHHSTADQFFTEPQFEAYRSLGEHVGDKLFLKTLVGDLDARDDVTVEAWFQALAQNLLEPL